MTIPVVQLVVEHDREEVHPPVAEYAAVVPPQRS
jgi:hypothetical protein